jgi:hypothetical protein
VPSIGGLIRTAVSAMGPSYAALSAQRVSTPQLLARLSVGIGLTTVNTSAVFTVMAIGFGGVFTAIPSATVAIGAVGLIANVIVARLYHAHHNPMGRALSRHAVAGTLIGVGTVAAGAAALTGQPAFGLSLAAGAGALAAGVGLTTIANLTLEPRHPVRSLVRLAHALPTLPLVLARRLLDFPSAMRELFVLVKVYVRFARTSDVRVPLTRPELGDPVFRATIQASIRYAIHHGYLVDTDRIWLDWDEISFWEALPDDLTDHQRRSAITAVHAGLTRREAARLAGVSRRTLRRWLAAEKSGHHPR